MIEEKLKIEITIKLPKCKRCETKLTHCGTSYYGNSEVRHFVCSVCKTELDYTIEYDYFWKD